MLVSTGMVSIPPINGGAVEAYVGDLARIFSHRAGFRVSVISNHRSPLPPVDAGAPRWVPTHSPIDSFPLRPAPSALAHLIGGSISAAVAFRHLERLTTTDPVLLHLNEEVSAITFARLGRKVGRIFTIHNPPPSTGDGNYGGLEYAIRQANARATWRFALRRMDAVIALTPWIGRFLTEEWGLSKDRVHVLPLPVDVEAFSPGPPESSEAGTAPRLLFVGRLEPRKNVLAAVDALAHLPSSAHLTVVGDGPLAEATGERARTLGLTGRVTVHQRIPVEGLVRLYRSSTALIHPSHLEAYPRVVVEAAACGLPSIVPELPMFDGFIRGGCAAGFDPQEGAPAIARAVEELASDPQRLGAARRSARQYVLTHCSYPVFGDRLARVYQSAVP